MRLIHHLLSQTLVQPSAADKIATPVAQWNFIDGPQGLVPWASTAGCKLCSFEDLLWNPFAGPRGGHQRVRKTGESSPAKVTSVLGGSLSVIPPRFVSGLRDYTKGAIMTAGLPVIDLFAGAGGLGLGARLAGGNLRLSIDNDPYSCETLAANPELHGGVCLKADVTTLTGQDLRRQAALGRADDLVVIGGAPCQPFSKAAYWVDKGDEAAYRRARARGEAVTRPTETPAARPDSRRTLVHEFLRLVLETDAAAFVFENVPSLLHPRNKHIFEALRADAEIAGYKTRTVVATATEYGAPQARQRVFLLGSLESQPDEPAITHSDHPTDGQARFVTAGDAFAQFDSGEVVLDDLAVEGRWAEHLRAVPPGENYKFHTAWAGHPTPSFETETRYWNFLLKLSPDRPSWTIPASPGPWTGPFHWDSRRLAIKELAALQCFPKGYQFIGTRREQVRQIGNAVPSVMASAMVGSAFSSLVSSQAAA